MVCTIVQRSGTISSRRKGGDANGNQQSNGSHSTEGKQPKITQKREDDRFDRYKEQFIERLWALYPGWASSQGYHNYDSVLVVPDEAQRSKEMAFCKANLDSLKQFDLQRLSDNNQTDYHLIESQLRSTEWYNSSFRSYEWNPSDYNVCGGFAEMLANNYDSLDVRLHHFYLRMKNIPAYYEAAKKQIKQPTAEHVQLAIDQNLGGLSTFREDLDAALAKANLPMDKDLFKARAAEAVKAITGYVDWLKTLKSTEAPSFRIGKELYTKKFEHDIQSGYTAEQIYRKALEHIGRRNQPGAFRRL